MEQKILEELMILSSGERTFVSVFSKKRRVLTVHGGWARLGRKLRVRHFSWLQDGARWFVVDCGFLSWWLIDRCIWAPSFYTQPDWCYWARDFLAHLLNLLIRSGQEFLSLGIFSCARSIPGTVVRSKINWGLISLSVVTLSPPLFRV